MREGHWRWVQGRVRPATFDERATAYFLDGLLFYGLVLLTLKVLHPTVPVFLNPQSAAWFGVGENLGVAAALQRSVSAGVLPFLPGALFKVLLAAATVPLVWRALRRRP